MYHLPTLLRNIMQVLSLSQYRTPGFSIQKHATPVSFSGRIIKNDNKLVEEYAYRFNTLLSNKKNDEVLIDKFFDDLSKENTKIKLAFLDSNEHNEYEYAFVRAIRWNDLVAEKMFEFIKNSDDTVKNAFLCGNRDIPSDTAPCIASEMGANDLAAAILDYINNDVREDIKRNFYNIKIKNGDGRIYTAYDSFRESGNFILANKYKNEESKYRKPEPKQSLQTEQNNKPKGNFNVCKDVKTRFADIGGMFNVKKELEKQFLSILKNPKAKNEDKPSAVLLEGSPGTGKTLLAMAIAGETKIPFISTAGSSFVELYVGTGAKHVRELYAEARELAANSPSKSAIVFIDEIDAVGGKRGGDNNAERNSTLNALLTEMDGVQSKQRDDIKIITVAATNRADMLDNALRGRRFDLEFTIDDPRFSEKARREIINVHTKKKPFESEQEKEKIISYLAKTSAGMSGAEIEKLITRAYREMLSEQRDFISINDVKNAYLNLKIGVANDVEVVKDEHLKTIAHEAGHALNLLVMHDVLKDEDLQKRPVNLLDCIINESRGRAAGMTVFKPGENNRYTIESLIASIVGTYGGFSAEEALFDGHTDGVRGDLENNTKKIMDAICKYGLGSKTRYIAVSGTNIFELFKHDIKRDLIDYSNIGMKISDMIAKFAAEFIKEYAENNYDKSENIVSGEKFMLMFSLWLENQGKKKEYETLCNDLRSMIVEFRKKIQGN